MTGSGHAPRRGQGRNAGAPAAKPARLGSVAAEIAGVDLTDIAQELAQEARASDIAVGHPPRKGDDIAVFQPVALDIADRALGVERDRDDLARDHFGGPRPALLELLREG